MTNCDFVAKTMEWKIMIIFSDDYFSSLILPYSDEKIFVTKTKVSLALTMDGFNDGLGGSWGRNLGWR